MKRLTGIVLLFLVSVSGLCAQSYRTPFSSALEAQVSAKKAVVSNPGMGRLWLMRFYFPKNEVQEAEGFWAKLFQSGDAEAQSRAAAFYLFNMYVSTAAYGEDMPTRLTTNYLGVLDGFYKTRRMFAVKDAEKFYKKNKEEIKDRLEEFFAKNRNLHLTYDKNNSANDKRELAFMRLLANAPVYRGRPAYYTAVPNKLTGQVAARDARFITEQLRLSLAKDQNKVVTFEYAYVRGEDLDRKVGIKATNVDRTYRKVNDECEYCSYDFCKQVCQRFNSPDEQWGLVRLYKITAAPINGGSLVPAEGNRFKLASGAPADNWSYHTATLLVMDRDGRFTPVVADKFLAGETPVPFGKWLTEFAPSKTLFYIAPFTRTEEMDNAVKTPQAVRGNNVVIKGETYRPAPIEQ